MSEYGKRFTALVAAGAAGFWLGINYMGMLIKPTNPLSGQPPAWVAEAEWMAYAAIAMLAIAAVGWMALDYRQQQA